ncbi:MAG: TrkA C-terminal domain-containing protein [Microcoleaceae cyanobacterium]
MAALISVFIAVTLSLLITRVAAEALVLTGLSRQVAQFQARSAFTGSGFTTAESEQVINHPVRRRIVMWLMFLGNAGIITVISSLVLTFVSTVQAGEAATRFLFLSSGLILLWVIATNPAFNRFLTRFVRWALQRWTDLDVRDYASLLNLQGEYQVTELEVQSVDWLAHKRLDELHLRDEGISILGIRRADRTYIGVPKGSTYILPGDIVILYGRQSALAELDFRRPDAAGDDAHQKACVVQQQIDIEQDHQDYLSQPDEVKQ